MIIKRLIKHIRRWNIWRKRNTNGNMHHILVLLGIIHSPTYEFTFLPEETWSFASSVKKGERKND